MQTVSFSVVVTKLSASAVTSDTPNKPRDKNELVCAFCAVSVGGISILVPISNEFLARRTYVRRDHCPGRRLDSTRREANDKMLKHVSFIFSL